MNDLFLNLPEPIVKVFSFLKEKESSGEFVFTTNFSSWSDAEDLIEPLNLGYLDHLYIRAAGLAYIVEQTGGGFSVPKSENIWSWANALAIITPVSGWSPVIMAHVVSSFPAEEDGVNGQLDNAVTLYSKAYFDNGLSLLSLLSQRRTCVLSGLMEGDYSRYCVLFPPQENQDEFAQAFMQANQMDDLGVERVFDTALTFSNFSSSVAIGLFLKAHHSLNEDRKIACEKRVLEILQSGPTFSCVSSVCHWCFTCNKATSFDEDCLIALIKGLDEEHKDLLETIDKTISFCYDDNPDFLCRVANCIADTFSPIDVVVMDNMLHSFHKHEEPFLQFTLSYILNTKGEYRIAGRRIWDNLHLESSSLDISSFSEDLQCVFIIFMLEDFGNPETRLPKILPLLMSGSTKVKTTLIKVIRPYLDDYMGHIISALDRLQIECEEASQIRKYFQQRSDFLQDRRGLKELSPGVTAYRVLEEAKRTERARLQEQVKEAEASYKPMWTEYMSTVVLARGGGFRDHNGTTRHLVPISHSVPLRMMVQSMSPLEQDEWVLRLLKDWNDTSGNH
jgi:hypothetical protein